MSIFAEKGQGTADTTAGLSIIGPGMKVVGDVTAEGVVKIEGSVTGTIKAGRQVLIAKGGLVEGDVITREAIVGGEVRGAILAEERVEVQATSVVFGDLTTRRLFVQEGGEINGVIRMGEDAMEQREANWPPQGAKARAASGTS